MGETLNRASFLGLAAAMLGLLGAGCGDSSSLTSPSPGKETETAVSSLPGRPNSGPSALSDLPFQKILCFGDSLTFGVTQRAPDIFSGASGELALVEGYVPKLWRRLEAKYGPGVELVNAGIPGETTTEGLDRIQDVVRTNDPDLVLLL